MPQAKTEVALQFSECCAAETAMQHWLFCSAEVIWTKSCAAANEKLHCNIKKTALQEFKWRFPAPLSCGFQAPTFRHPRLGPAEKKVKKIREIFCRTQKWFCLRSQQCNFFSQFFRTFFTVLPEAFFCTFFTIFSLIFSHYFSHCFSH